MFERFFVNRKSKKMLAQNQFGTGAIHEEVDPEERLLSTGIGVFDWTTGFSVEAELSKKYNLTFNLRPEDQNGSSSCVGQSTATYATVLNCWEKGTLNKLSARDIYSNIYIKSTGGAYIGDALDFMVNRGVLLEQICPSYEEGVRPPSEYFMRQLADQTAQNEMIRDIFTSRSWIRVNAYSIDEVAKAMALNMGVILGIDGENDGSWYSFFPNIPKGVGWSHAIYAIEAKLIGGKKCITFINSWGDVVGIGGRQALTEDWFKSGRVFGCWVLTDELNYIVDQDQLEKIDLFIRSKPALPHPDNSPYYEPNWTFITDKFGLQHITTSKYYDYARVKLLREQYKF